MLQQLDIGLYGKAGDIFPHILSFDLDYTLICPIKSKLGNSADDFMFLPNRLQFLYENRNSTIVIFTNQNYKGKKLQIALDKINNVDAQLMSYGINCWIFVATEKNIYRKPDIGMWLALK